MHQSNWDATLYLTCTYMYKLHVHVRACVPIPVPKIAPTQLQGSLSGATEIILGTVDRGRFGNSLASLGDVDDDGYDGR